MAEFFRIITPSLAGFQTWCPSTSTFAAATFTNRYSPMPGSTDGTQGALRAYTHIAPFTRRLTAASLQVIAIIHLHPVRATVSCRQASAPRQIIDWYPSDVEELVALAVGCLLLAYIGSVSAARTLILAPGPQPRTKVPAGVGCQPGLKSRG
jgi:hypothetical protein